MESAGRYYLLSEMAEMKGLPARALADAARAGKLKTYKVHGRRYVTELQIDEYMKQFLSGPPEVTLPSPPEGGTERFLRKVDQKRWRRSLKG